MMNWSRIIPIYGSRGFCEDNGRTSESHDTRQKLTKAEDYEQKRRRYMKNNKMLEKTRKRERMVSPG